MKEAICYCGRKITWGYDDQYYVDDKIARNTETYPYGDNEDEKADEANPCVVWQCVCGEVLGCDLHGTGSVYAPKRFKDVDWFADINSKVVL